MRNAITIARIANSATTKSIVAMVNSLLRFAEQVSNWKSSEESALANSTSEINDDRLLHRQTSCLSWLPTNQRIDNDDESMNEWKMSRWFQSLPLFTAFFHAN
jgi:hypothetical protein